MNREVLISGFTKLLNGEVLTDEETAQVTSFACHSFFLPDMLDADRQLLSDSTSADVSDNFKLAIINTVINSVNFRFGL